MIDSVKNATNDKMAKTIDALKAGFQKIRTGRATPDLLDGITVDYYGNPSAINAVANVSAPEARMIAIQPWEKTLLPDIEKAILASNLGLAPQNDGNVIRLNIPALTEERRKELAKDAKTLGEDAKVSLRNIRRDSNDSLKKAEKAKELSEDLMKDGMEEIQVITDGFVKQVDALVKVKAEEIMSV